MCDWNKECYKSNNDFKTVNNSGGARSARLETGLRYLERVTFLASYFNEELKKISKDTLSKVIYKKNCDEVVDEVSTSCAKTISQNIVLKESAEGNYATSKECNQALKKE